MIGSIFWNYWICGYCDRYPFTDTQPVQTTDWELYVVEIANDIISEQSPKRWFSGIVRSWRMYSTDFVRKTPDHRVLKCDQNFWNFCWTTYWSSNLLFGWCRLFQVRGKLYELLSNCIPPEIILKVDCFVLSFPLEFRFQSVTLALSLLLFLELFVFHLLVYSLRSGLDWAARRCHFNAKGFAQKPSISGWWDVLGILTHHVLHDRRGYWWSSWRSWTQNLNTKFVTGPPST